MTVTLLDVHARPAPGGRCAAAALRVRVRCERVPDDARIRWMAAAPAVCGAAWAGSGLPHASARSAFEPTPNRGEASVALDGTATLELPARPGAYYVGLGTVRVPPTVYVAYTLGGERVQAALPLDGDGGGVPPIAFRSLTWPATRAGAAFYDVPDRRVRSQEEMLYASAYPSAVFAREPANFWGARPPR